MSFAENLRQIRLEKKLTQQELAAILEVRQSAVGMWETGRRTPKLHELRRMALVLNITVERLISDNQQKVEITNDALYVDGQKVEELDVKDIQQIVKLVNSLKSEKKSKPSGIDRKSGSKPKKILIIDDEQEICETLYSYLVPHNYKVFLTFNGQMGLEYFNEIKPDVILLDLTMPDIDGIEVLKIIRKVSNVPVLIITGHPEDVVDIHLNELHIEGYIEKPFALEQILNTLKHLIGE
ncbi:MAG TPA: response regulator [Candidatus Omnitrophota bacterium]|nr:response regulator [Candidatus Omnitrophota bacterium]HPS19434.1 response regulator [Candidatus Omnitrophota bacterium]